VGRRGAGHKLCIGQSGAAPALRAERCRARLAQASPCFTGHALRPRPPSPSLLPPAASPLQEMPLEAFAAPLQRVAVARMVRQLSEVYSVMRVSTMSELAPFIGFGQVSPGQLAGCGCKWGSVQRASVQVPAALQLSVILRCARWAHWQGMRGAGGCRPTALPALPPPHTHPHTHTCPAGRADDRGRRAQRLLPGPL
jgi:hypothetical protein